MPAPNDALIGTKMDVSKPYATVYGEANYKYEQEGLRFGANLLYCGRAPGWRPPVQSTIPQGGGLVAVQIKLKDLNLRVEMNRDIQITDNTRLMAEYKRLTGVEFRGKREGLIKAIRQIYRRVVAAVSRQIPEAIITDWVPNPSTAEDLGGAPPEDPEEEGDDSEPPENPDGEGHDGDAPPAVELTTQATAEVPALRIGRPPSRDLDSIAESAAANRAAQIAAAGQQDDADTF